VTGDATRLSQVIANLLNNAGKYTIKGGAIALQAETIDDTLHIRVIDNGIGIEPEKIDSLFDLFVQASHAPDRAQDGLGIGLSLVKNLVGLHAGQVVVTSKGVGQGSKFEITLPMLTHAPVAKLHEQVFVPTAPATAEVRILIVDDNVDAAESLAVSLRECGYQVETAKDAESALQIAQQFLPTAIVLDIGLPGMNGYELAHALRQLPSTKHARLIALSGYGQEKDKQSGLAAGFDSYLVKPADTAQIQAVIHGQIKN